MTQQEKKEELFKKMAKDICRNFLSRGMSMREVCEFANTLVSEAEYQVQNNTIAGLSNGKII